MKHGLAPLPTSLSTPISAAHPEAYALPAVSNAHETSGPHDLAPQAWAAGPSRLAYPTLFPAAYVDVSRPAYANRGAGHDSPPSWSTDEGHYVPAVSPYMAGTGAVASTGAARVPYEASTSAPGWDPGTIPSVSLAPLHPVRPQREWNDRGRQLLGRPRLRSLSPRLTSDLVARETTARRDAPEPQRSVSSARPFPCTFCARAFARKHDLERHARVHVRPPANPVGRPALPVRRMQKRVPPQRRPPAAHVRRCTHAGVWTMPTSQYPAGMLAHPRRCLRAHEHECTIERIHTLLALQIRKVYPCVFCDDIGRQHGVLHLEQLLEGVLDRYVRHTRCDRDATCGALFVDQQRH